ncbi:MAG: nucleotidyltransferase family protein [Candidatus Schekmanbacteria bacterium]|nr:nucleotidyltransferase family protein [Candidatus Schekmanbacteria bacterium]
MVAVDRAVVLAAGKGTRLGSLTAQVPKPLVSVGGRPLLDHILSGLVAAGARSFAIITGYLEDAVHDFISQWSDRNVPRESLFVECVSQGDMLGTGHALLQLPSWWRTAPTIVAFGDILVADEEYVRLREVAAERAGTSVMAVATVDDPCEGAAVYVDATGLVTRLVEKPPRGTSTTKFINVGLFSFLPELFPILEEIQPSARGEIELTSALDVLAGRRRLAALPLARAFIDIGTPERLALANDWAASR